MKLVKFNNKNIKKKNVKKVFNFLTSNIKKSVFEVFGFDFFLDTIKINCNFSYYIKDNNKIISYIAYVNEDNEKLIKNLMFRYILKYPAKFFFILLKNIKFFFKFHSSPKKYIQLMHLIIRLKNKNKKKRVNKIINKIHKQVVKLKYDGVYAMYDRNNFIADKYYKKNYFKVYDQNIFFCFVKKKLNGFNKKTFK
jgi:hypothetical protein